jgi:D-glycero-alpha-D-manno-heptose-7-phosphate kinase
MIITRTPFRVTLGGGGTDLPSYYSRYGGFIFSFAIDKYVYINVNRPVADNFIRLKYSSSEKVSKVKDLKHDIARASLETLRLSHSIEIASMADIPAGSGLGSSSCYTVGLLHALHTLKREYLSLHRLADEACNIEIDILQKPMGKQDQYLAAFGGFTVLEISKDGKVLVSHANVSNGTLEDLKSNLLIFFTGVKRINKKILGEQNRSTIQNEKKVLESLHYIKESGYKILEIVESGNITELGKMFDEHWQYKKKLAKGITNSEFDKIYDTAMKNGALGGKISGAGGGGFFLFYCEEGKHKLRSAMADMGLKEMRFDFDFEGTKILANFMTYRGYKA